MGNVLKLPAFRRLLVAYSLNELAYWIGALALALLVYRKTGTALGAIGFFLCSLSVPALLAPLVVGRIERLDTNRLLPGLYGLEAVAFAVLAFIAGHFNVAAALVVITIDGVIALSARGIARAASVAVTSPHALLREGNALLNGSFSVCFMAGPAIGAAVVAAGGLSVTLLVNAGLFAVVAVSLLGVRLPHQAPSGQGGRNRLRAGLRYARDHAGVRAVLVLQGGAVLFFSITAPVEVIFAERTLHSGSAGYAALLAVWGGGTVVGSLFYVRLRALPSRTLVAAGAGLIGLGIGVMALAPSIGVATAGAAVAGAGNGIESVAARTALQELVEPDWMTIIVSLGESVAQGVPGLGILLGGALVALFGTRYALGVAAVGSVGAAALARVVLPVPRPAARMAPASPATVRLGCIDIGSNTTRLLVADCHNGSIEPVREERAFTSIGRALTPERAIPPAKLDEVVAVVRGQLASAGELDASPVFAVATAAVRRAANGQDLARRIVAELGLDVRVLDPAEEARLAFLGAATTLGSELDQLLGVVDLGGGSCELAVGRRSGAVEWFASIEIGSSTLTEGHLHSDPPRAQELRQAEAAIERALAGLEVPRVGELVAVGGSATSVRRLVGDCLDAAALQRALAELTRAPAAETALRLQLELERVRVLPAGLLVLEALTRRFGVPLQVGRGGLREGVLIDASR